MINNKLDQQRMRLSNQIQLYRKQRHNFYIIVLCCCCILLQFSYCAAKPRNKEIETTREEILASRQRRSKQIETILEESKARLNDHNNKRKLLTDTEKNSLEKKMSIYTRKLEQLNADLDEREIERILRKEKLRNEILAEKRKREEL